MRPAAAALAFVAVSVTMAVVTAFFTSGLTPFLAWCSLATGAIAGLVAAFSTRSAAADKPTAWDWAMGVLFALASLRAFLWLIYPTAHEWRVLSPNNLGDMSLHLQFIRYLASGVSFWPESPILAGVPMTYPLGSDLFNSLLLLLGVPVERGLVWTGLAGAALCGWMLWQWGRAFGLAAFLFNGGLAGFLIFQTGAVADFQSELAWKNFFLSMLVTQRGLLYAIPAGLFLLQAWRQDAFQTPSVPRWLQIVLYATMPLFSVHTFLFLSLTLAVLFLGSPASRIRLLRFVLVCFIPATAFVVMVTGFFSASSGLRFMPGWMQGNDGWMFWVVNFGISLILLPVLAWKAARDPEARCFVGAGALTFLIGLNIAFAPWEWDNTKLLVWGWLVCVPWLWSLVIAPMPNPLRVATCVLLFFSGAVSLVGGLDGRHGYTLANRAELARVQHALADIPPTDRIAVDPRYNHPVILLGRPVYCGYEGHLWSHGLDYRGPFETLQSILRQEPGWRERARGMDAEWVYFDGNPPVIFPAGR